MSNRSGHRGIFEWFIHSEVTGSILLLACTAAALVWANSPWVDAYDQLLHMKIGVSWGDAAFKLTLHHWVNDGLMVIFFFVIGLEIKRELVVGQLSSVQRAVLPVAAALGGMVVPALLYVAVNLGGEGAVGWGVPMATDIAFALGLLAVFGKRVPLGLKVFLAALAIADDLGAVLVIALFYTESIRWSALLAAAVLLAALLAAVRLRVRRLGFLLALIVGVWLGVFISGVHATVAGILVAMVIPVRARIEPARFLARARQSLEELQASGLSRESMVDDHRQLDAIESLHEAASDMRPAGLALEHYLHPVQVWLILPLFALFNAGIPLGGGAMEALGSPVSLGILLGLVVGKPLGITLMAWLAVRSGHGSLPEGVTWMHVVGAGCLAGIGFTMSLFITELAFVEPPLVQSAKIGILAASALSAIFGFVLLSRTLPRNA